MDSAIRRYGKTRGDVEAAEKLVKQLESMGYNLNCDSFITKGSSQKTSEQIERYAATRIKKEKCPSRYNFDGVDSDEESSSSSSDDDDDTSDDSDDDDCEDSSEEESTEDKVQEIASKKEVVQKMALENSDVPKGNEQQVVADKREPVAPSSINRETSRLQLKHLDDEREGPVLIVPNKDPELAVKKRNALPKSKRSGINRIFQKDQIKSKGSRSSHSAISQSSSNDKRSESKSNDSFNGKDAIQRQRSASTTATASAKSTKSQTSAKSSSSGKSPSSSKTSKTTATSKKTETSKKSKISAISAISAHTKKSEVSALTERSWKRSKASGIASISTSEGMTTKTSSPPVINAGVGTASPGHTLGHKQEILPLHETDIEQDQDSVAEDDDDDEEEMDLLVDMDDIHHVNQSDSSEDGPVEFSAIEAIGTIEASNTALNEGALEISVREKSRGVQSPEVRRRVESVTMGQSVNHESQVEPMVEDDAPLITTDNLPNVLKKDDIPANTTEQTESSQSEGHESVVSEGPMPNPAPSTADEMVRPKEWINWAEQGFKSKIKSRIGIFRRNRLQLTVNPRASLTTQDPAKATDRAVVVDKSYSLLTQQASPPPNDPATPSGPVEEVLIEGMSVVRRGEIIEDQIFDGDEHDILCVDDMPIKQDQPLLISPKHDPLAHRRLNNRHSSPYRARPISPPKRNKSPSVQYKKPLTKKLKSKTPFTPSQLQRRLSEEQKPLTPTVNFIFPPEEREYQPDPLEIEIMHGKRRPKFGKFLGKIFSRKDKREKPMPDETPEEELSVYEDEDGLEFRVRSPARSFEERIFEASSKADEERQDEGTEDDTPRKSVFFADTVRVSTARHCDGGGIEAKIPSDESVGLGSDSNIGDFLEVEVDNEENHAGEEDEALRARIAKKSRENRLQNLAGAGGATMETSDSVDTGAAVTKVTDIVTALGDFMRSLTASAEPDPHPSNPIQIKASLPIRHKTIRTIVPSGDNSTVDTSVLQAEYPNNCRDNNPVNDANYKKLVKKPKAASTLEGGRLVAMSPTRRIDYNTVGDVISAESHDDSVDVWSGPSTRTKLVPLKSALKTPVAKGKPTVSGSVPAPTSLVRRTRSTPSLYGPKSLKSAKSLGLTKGGGRTISLLPGTPASRRVSSLKKIPMYEVGYDPIPPAMNHEESLSVVSPKSTTAIADQLSPSASYDADVGSTVSSLRAPSNLETMTTKSKEWIGIDEEQAVEPDEAARWAEVNNAANVLGRVMGQVEKNNSTDTNDEARHLHQLLSEDSTMGDVQKALAVLKRHAERMGVRETDLLLAAAKSEDTEEIFSVRSWTIGEELLDMWKSYFRGRR